MKEWLTPEGITAVVTIVLLLLSVAKNVAQALGRKDLAAKLGEAEGKAATFSRVAGTLVKGVERVKREGKVDPKAVTALVATLREENLLNGVEEVVAPIVAEVKSVPIVAAVDPVAAVQRATARLEPKADPATGRLVRRVS
jgi:hypothetical protein